MNNYSISVRCKILRRTQSELCRAIRENNPDDPTLSKLTPAALCSSISGSYSPLARSKILTAANLTLSRWEQNEKEGI